MTERDDTPEGWGVRRRPAYIGMAVVPAMLLVVLSIAGWAYSTYLEPHTREPFKTFPAPGVETFIHDGLNDPERKRPPAGRSPAVGEAERAMLANTQGWGE